MLMLIRLRFFAEGYPRSSFFDLYIFAYFIVLLKINRYLIGLKIHVVGNGWQWFNEPPAYLNFVLFVPVLDK